jgi:hypothetical protein
MVMKLKFTVLTALLLVCFATGTYAAKKELDDRDGITLVTHQDSQEETANNTFDDDINELSKHHANANPILHMAQHDNDEHHGNNGQGDHHDIGNNDGHKHHGGDNDNHALSQIPVPAAFWLFGSGLLGLVSASRNKSKVNNPA